MENDDAIKLLLAKPAFVGDVRALRSKWKIPPKGYKTNKEWNAWRDTITDTQSLELQADLDELVRSHNLSERWSSPYSPIKQKGL